MRLQRPKHYRLDVTLTSPLPGSDEVDFGVLKPNAAPAVDLSGTALPHRLPATLLSHVPKPSGPGSLMLDLGCGRTLHRAVCEQIGFSYVGVDHDSVHATILADAHSLPFKGDTFEWVMSIAVLAHLRFPLVAMREVHRVLKPAGTFVGTAAFLEPYTETGYYRYTHLGLLNTLDASGFMVQSVAPDAKWTGLVALAGGLFPRMPARLAKALVSPVERLHRAWWAVGRHSTRKGKDVMAADRIRSTTGAFAFVATKR